MNFSVHRAAIFAIGLATLAGGASVRADTGPVYVIPGRPGIPVAINGRDASWSVVEGDIGLARPGHLTPVIIGGGRPLPDRSSYTSYQNRNHYFPRYGTMPMRGRQEIEPPLDRPMPEPAESFSRSWSTSSEPQLYERPRAERPRQQTYQSDSENLPATIDEPMQFPPPIIVAPGRRRP